MIHKDNPRHRDRFSLWGGFGAVLIAMIAGFTSCRETPPPDLTAMGVDSSFVTVIIPILKDQCEDCHFPGGPLYKTMPFDDLSLVTELEDALLTRLSGGGRDRVAEWLDLVRASR